MYLLNVIKTPDPHEGQAVGKGVIIVVRLLAALVTSCRDSGVKDGPGWYFVLDWIHRRHS